MNSTKQSYVIWRTYGAGFWSIVASTIAHCEIAERSGLVPIVDMGKYPTVYNEPKPILGTFNSWEYYFQQPAGRTLEEIGHNPFFTDGKIPNGYPREIGDDRYRDLWKRYITLQPHILKKIKRTVSEFEVDKATLGVHFRGQEMRTALGHKFPPTLKQMTDTIKLVLDEWDFDRILLVTEAEQYVSHIIRAFGSRVRPSPTFRLTHKNSYTLSEPPRDNHRFHLGFEALQDAYLLAESGGLIRGHSGLSEAALLLSEEPFKPHIRISQGRNSFRPWVAPWKWYMKAALPEALGGFKRITPDRFKTFQV